MRFDAENDQDAITISHSEYVMDIYSGERATRVGSKTFGSPPSD